MLPVAEIRDRGKIAVNKYVVRLSCKDRKRLEALTHAGKRRAQPLTKARTPLKADSSEARRVGATGAISAALDISVNNIGRLRRRLDEEGSEAGNSARPGIFDGRRMRD
jgi:hypothetical protein